ncbi:hypothetical protein ACFYNY_17095 [Streptomyces sp. NPDC006530]|uniref:hypothetical protein n=1 Tax=Streptomyces sp. NPDC006530 TaxID=3364750 RepID=UPI0036C92D92
MTGTDEVEAAATATDEALYVLTAALLTPAQFPSVLGDDYPEACAALGLGPYAQGYGLVLGQDGAGARWTVVVDDVSLVAVAIASWDCGMEYDLSPDDRTVVAALPGWPLELVVAAPNVPAPHDPEPHPDGPRTLTPPDTSEWGPAQRRLGADAVALQWTMWREQLDPDTFGPPAAGAARDESGAASEHAEPHEVTVAPSKSSGAGSGDMPEATGHDAEEPGAEKGEETGESGESGSSAGGAASPDRHDAVESDAALEHGVPDADDAEHERQHPNAPGEKTGVQRALAELRGYLDSAPPLGRVRSAFAPGGARTLRADGPGWSVVARTDDVAFVLLDECPGDVHPVARDEELPALLRSLEAMAVRPS